MIATRLVVGVSANVIDSRVGDLRLDGIGTYTAQLVRSLQQRHVAVRRVGAPVRRGFRMVGPAGADVSFALPSSVAVPFSAFTHSSHPGARRVEEAISVYHSTDYVIPRLRHTPVVATLYDAILFADPPLTRARWRTLKRHIMRKTAPQADCIIAISHAAVPEIVERFRVPASRIRVIHLGLEPGWYQRMARAEVSQALARMKLSPGYFLCVGTLQPRKNVSAVLAAYDRLPVHVRNDRPVVVAGKYGWSVPELREELLRRCALGQCKWLDYVPSIDLRALYAGAGALVFPSIAEGFGLPMLEALAMGTAVVASDLPVLREVGGEEVTFVPPRDIEALAQAMLHVAEATASASAPAKRVAHAQRFAWSQCVDATLAVYRELTASGASQCSTDSQVGAP